MKENTTVQSKDSNKKISPLVYFENFTLKKEIFDEFFMKKCEEAFKLKNKARKITKPDINPNELKVSKEILSCKFKTIVIKILILERISLFYQRITTLKGHRKS
jgi:hypothetical protein